CLAYRVDDRCFFLSSRRRHRKFLQMAGTREWSDDDISILAKLPTEEYRKIFKQYAGPELFKIVDACLQFKRIGNASDAMRAVAKSATEALRLIGSESPINAIRVRKYGIEVKDKHSNRSVGAQTPSEN